MSTPHFIDVTGVTAEAMPYYVWLLGNLAESEDGIVLIPGAE